MKTKLTRDFFIPSGYTLYKSVDGVYAAYTNESFDHGVAVFFIGRQSRPAWHYRFGNHAAAIAKIDKTIADVEAWNKRKADSKAETKKPHSLKVDDILYSSWGYEQTNIDFYKVTKVVSNRTVEISPMTSKYSDKPTGNSMAAYVMPDDSKPLGAPMRKIASADNLIKITSYATAFPWDGRALYSSWNA